MNTVVLVGNIPKEGKESFARRFQGKLNVVEAATAAEAAAVSDATYLVVRGPKYPAEEIARLPKSVKMLSRWGVGYDSVDHFSRTFKSTHNMSPQAYRRLTTKRGLRTLAASAVKGESAEKNAKTEKE